jgi:prepilin-type N-terminal cleavage/methylation domain-containing protein
MRSTRGFTLLEVLMTVVLIAVGITALVIAFSRGIAASADVSSAHTAASLAQLKLEEVQNTAFASIASEARAAVSGFTGFDREVTVTASPGSTDANLKQVDIIVYWTVKGGEISQTVTSFVAN